MVLKHWGLTEHPFRLRGAERRAPLSGSQLEALARLRFLVDAAWPVGWLAGSEGTGKSLLLARLALDLGRRGLEVLRWSALGAPPGDLAARLAPGALLAATDDSRQLWRRVEDRLRSAFFTRRPLVILADDAQHLETGPLGEVRRLLNLSQTTQARLSVVLASGAVGQAAGLGWIAERGALRVELSNWDLEEWQTQLAELLELAGARQEIFDLPAVERLHALSGGRPGHLLSLAELCLAAGAAQELPKIDLPCVEWVYESLDAAGSGAHPPQETTAVA